MMAWLVRLYLEEKAPAWASHSLLRARRDLEHLARFFEERPLTREGVLAFARAIRGKRTPREAPWAPRTVAGVLGCARGLLRWAALRGHVLVDLGVLIPCPVPQPLPRVLSEENVERLLEAPLCGPCAVRDRAILELLYGTGLRASEAVRLVLDDLDLASGLVVVRMGKGAKDRVVPLGSRAGEKILAYLRHERPRRPGPLLLRMDGHALSSKGLGEIVAAAGRRAGLEGPVSPHRLRHSYATHLLRRGAPLPAIKALLGHASLVSTQVYLGLEVSDLKRMIGRSHPRESGKLQ